MPSSLPSWLKRLLATLVLACGLVCLATTLVIGPWVRDDLRLDWVVRAVALDWRDQGLEAAHTRLQYELDHQDIGGWVADDDCRLQEQETQRVVECTWTAELNIPMTQRTIPIPFSSRAAVTEDGDIQ